MNHEEHDELWTLLGKARKLSVPPFFVSKVMRAVRAVEEPQPGILAWLRRRWMVPVAASACAAIAVALAFYRPGAPQETLAAGSDPLEEMVTISTGAPEIPSLDTLLASDDHSIWLETDSSSLF